MWEAWGISKLLLAINCSPDDYHVCDACHPLYSCCTHPQQEKKAGANINFSRVPHTPAVLMVSTRTRVSR